MTLPSQAAGRTLRSPPAGTPESFFPETLQLQNSVPTHFTFSFLHRGSVSWREVCPCASVRPGTAARAAHRCAAHRCALLPELAAEFAGAQTGTTLTRNATCLPERWAQNAPGFFFLFPDWSLSCLDRTRVFPSLCCSFTSFMIHVSTYFP